VCLFIIVFLLHYMMYIIAFARQVPCADFLYILTVRVYTGIYKA
jgi:hypothetical protein